MIHAFLNGLVLTIIFLGMVSTYIVTLPNDGHEEPTQQSSNEHEEPTQQSPNEHEEPQISQNEHGNVFIKVASAKDPRFSHGEYVKNLSENRMEDVIYLNGKPIDKYGNPIRTRPGNTWKPR